MNHIDQLRHNTRLLLFAGMVTSNIAGIVAYWQLSGSLSKPLALLASASTGVVLAGVVAYIFGSLVSAPIKALWQAVLHLNPDEQGVAAPETETLAFGRDLVTSLTAQIYQLANVADQAAAQQYEKTIDLHQNFIAQNMPLPLFVLDPSETIVFANEAAAQYIGIKAADMIGKNAYMVLDMSFPSPDTFDVWLGSVKTKSATASSAWERVRLNIRDNHPSRLFDLSAYYNRDNPNHHETMLILFDHTQEYSQDEQAVSFIALSVHELRTPLTLLRGYIEVFQEELSTTMDPEMQGFILKMRSQADQLTAFVNNILNVARVEDDQLELKLHSEDWNTIVKSAIEAVSLRAKVRGIALKCRLSMDLPAVGVDNISIREVINNLVDNAIKYSGTSKEIQITTVLNKEGLVETSIQDYGLGISSNVLPNLFTKFYRDHRNRAQIGGTGLGLYLSKAIVDAHGGSISIQSKEGEGSTFSFTLQPYTQLAEGQKAGQTDITRNASGWIKNHSLYKQ